MDQTTDFSKMLEMIPAPAFTVCDGRISLCNREAKLCLIEPGTPIDDLLLTGSEEYAQLENGCLYLTIRGAGRNWGASATRLEGQDLFRLEPEGIPAEVKAMALLCAELRYPVSTLSLLRFPEGTDKAAAATANQELNKILRILNNVTNAERFLSDQPHPLQEQDVYSVLYELLEESAALLEHAGITLHFEVPDGRLYTLINYQALKHAVYNLLDNAAKFTEPGGTIRVTVIRSGKTLRLSIADQGTGIPAELRSGIFSRYTRQPGIDEGQQNLGLGMALVRAAASIHSGTVLVDAPEGVGTRVTMTLALRNQTEDTLRAPQALKVIPSHDGALVMLSNVLPRELYTPGQFTNNP